MKSITCIADDVKPFERKNTRVCHITLLGLQPLPFMKKCTNVHIFGVISH